MGEEALLSMNKNVNWMNSPHFWTFYMLLLLAARAWMPLFVVENHAWTATNVVHGVVSCRTVACFVES